MTLIGTRRSGDAEMQQKNAKCSDLRSPWRPSLTMICVAEGYPGIQDVSMQTLRHLRRPSRYGARVARTLFPAQVCCLRIMSLEVEVAHAKQIEQRAEPEAVERLGGLGRASDLAHGCATQYALGCRSPSWRFLFARYGIMRSAYIRSVRMQAH